MRYLIIQSMKAAQFRAAFDGEKDFVQGVGMQVYDLSRGIYTVDGITWNVIIGEK